jgi:arabinose-5-phosphate isomerase
MKVDEIMRRDAELTVVPESATVRETMIRMNHTPRRPGAACIVDSLEPEKRTLLGIFTDGDLARFVEKHASLDERVSGVMCKSPRTIASGALASEALKLLRDNRIDQVPVIDAGGRIVGLVDVQDLLATGVV